jgi:hypothetical protein
MSQNDTALALREKAPISVGNQGVEIQSLDELYRFAKFVASSPFAPSGFKEPESIVVAIQYGYELGLTPMQSLQNLAVINGKPSIYGDAMLALVRASGLLEEFSEGLVTRTKAGRVVCTCSEFADKSTCVHVRVAASHIERPNEEMVQVCHVKRRGFVARNAIFGMVEARRAGLIGKPGPWQQYPDRMLLFRARGFGLRDEFSDVLKGLVSVEEAADYDMVMGGGHRVGDGHRVVEMPRSRTEELKARLADARPEVKAAIDVQAPTGMVGAVDAAADLGVVIDAEELEPGAELGQASDDEPEYEILSTDQLNQLVALCDERGLDEGHRIELAARFGAADLKLIPAA